MDSKGNWSFAPVYDLIFSYGHGGEHSCTIAGEGRNPAMKDIMKLAELSDISPKDLSDIVNDVQASLNNWESLAPSLNIRKTDIAQVSKSLYASAFK